MKTLIAVPCMDMVNAPFAQSLCAMTKVGECHVSFMVGSLIYDARNSLCEQALKIGADAILWLDSDMLIPPDAMVRLMKHIEEGKDIVSGLYFNRKPDYRPTLFKSLDVENGKCKFTDYNDYPKDSVFEIDGCGFGCVAMRVPILTKMVLEKGNWFAPAYNSGEDIAFCIRAKELGYKIWCDSSIKFGHCGHIIVNEDMWDAIKG